jgi:hypothetical protein
MSTGERIPLEDADRTVEYLFRRWNLDREACMAVGSVRRRRESVGDIELVAPCWNGAGVDVVFESIAATMEGEITDARTAIESNLFAPGREPRVIPKVQPLIGTVAQGCRPGFLHARIRLRRRDGSTFACEVYRYTPANRGWITLMRTGPGEFGRFFLRFWKRAHNIPETREASSEGHLRDARGEIIPVPTEEECFRLCGMKFIDPRDRDSQAAAWESNYRRGVIAIR